MQIVVMMVEQKRMRRNEKERVAERISPVYYRI